MGKEEGGGKGRGDEGRKGGEETRREVKRGGKE
jgi:hypothetical protein